MKLTKITAMAAAIATVAGLGAVAASSANAQVVTDGEKTITLNATSADQLTGHTFKVVKVASYDVYGTAPNQSVTLKTEDGLKTDIAKYLKYTAPAIHSPGRSSRTRPSSTSPPRARGWATAPPAASPTSSRPRPRPRSRRPCPTKTSRPRSRWTARACG